MSPPLDIAASYEECRSVARNSASNFYYAFYLLPEPKRRALCALYAFMRLVDDAADEPGSVAAKQRGLRDGARSRMPHTRVKSLATQFCPPLPILARAFRFQPAISTT